MKEEEHYCEGKEFSPLFIGEKRKHWFIFWDPSLSNTWENILKGIISIKFWGKHYNFIIEKLSYSLKIEEENSPPNIEKERKVHHHILKKKYIYFLPIPLHYIYISILRGKRHHIIILIGSHIEMRIGTHCEVVPKYTLFMSEKHSSYYAIDPHEGKGHQSTHWALHVCPLRKRRGRETILNFGSINFVTLVFCPPIHHPT